MSIFLKTNIKKLNLLFLVMFAFKQYKSASNFIEYHQNIIYPLRHEQSSLSNDELTP